MSLRRILALAMAGALLVSGCQDEPQPRFEDPTESPTPSASESNDPPEKQSAEEFIREWVRLQTEMQNTGDTQRFRAMSKGCEPCEAFARRVESIYDRGGFIETTGWRLDNITCTGPSSSKRCKAHVKSAPTKFRESSSAAVKSLPGGSIEVVFEARHSGPGWAMANTYQESS